MVALADQACQDFVLRSHLTHMKQQLAFGFWTSEV